MKHVKFRAEPVKGRDLEPGDLFSVAGSEYWEPEHWSIGERVYVRTNTPAPEDELDADIFRIIIEVTDD